MKDNIKLDYLDTFVVVAKKKTILDAAKELHLAQSTVSTRIATIERYYGVKAFNRSLTGVTLTKEGKIIFEAASAIMKIYNDSLASVYEEYKYITEHLYIGTPIVPGLYILPKIIQNYKKEYPDKKVITKIEDMEVLIRKLKEEKYDVVCVTSRAVEEEYIQKNCKKMLIGQDELALAVPLSHKLSNKKEVAIKEIVDYPFLAPILHSDLYIEVKRILEREGTDYSDLNVTTYLDWPGTMITAVEKELGIAILSSLPIEEAISNNNKIRLVRILGVDESKRNFYLICNKSAYDRKDVLKNFWDSLALEQK